MATGPGAPQGDDRQKWLTILVPAVGVAALVILAALVATMSTPPAGGGGKGGGGAAGGKAATDAELAKLTDGTAPGAEDSGLRDIGDGLKIRDLKEGQGEACPPGASVVAHYTGWLTNGNIFDSSRRRGEPSPFSLKQVVRGWQLGIPGMKVGGVRKLVIPSELGYGARGQGAIPPNATLIFEVELVSFK